MQLPEAKFEDKMYRYKNGRVQHLNMRSSNLVFNESDKTIINKPLEELAKAEKGILRLPRSTLLVGDGLYNDVWHPKEELEKSYTTLDRQPFIIDHGDGISHEVGWMETPTYDKNTHKLTAVPVLNLNTTYGKTALGFIQNRLLAGKAPETSVGFWATETTEKINQLDNIEKLTARNWEFDHNSLVSRGACGPSDGAGIGLNKNKINNNKKMEEKIMNDGDTPTDSKVTNTVVAPVKNNIEAIKAEMLTREDFRALMKEELAKVENDRKMDKQIAEFKKAMKEKRYEDAEKLSPFADKNETSDLEILKKKFDELEKSMSHRTTPTRDMITNDKPLNKLDKTSKEYKRAQILTGRAICQYVYDNPEERLNLSVKKNDYDDIPDYALGV